MHFSITDKKIKSSDVLKTLIVSSGEINKWIEFNDKHLNSPMACFILCNLIRQCQDYFDFTINSITLNIERLTDYDNYRDHILEHHFQTLKEQEETIISYFRTILEITPIIKRVPIYQHERDLIFTENDFRMVILPNGGINWGWQDNLYHNIQITSKFTPDLKKIKQYINEFHRYLYLDIKFILFNCL